MSVKPDSWIRDMCASAELIDPWLPALVRQVQDRRIISAGLSSYGYDMRLAEDGFKVFTPVACAEIDPKGFNSACLIEPTIREDWSGAKYWLLPPHSYALGVTIETFKMPTNVLGICFGKSTYARCGLIVNTTPLEPGWCGRLVLELSNSANLPIRVYANEGIAQVVFFEGQPCETTYADRQGKYQNQAGLVTARV